ncbi:MAG: hypothetical protein UV36_C0006G0010 [Parcubacteria group bacterium GW2011_GWC2_42_6]|nr:MAG: hypothetical protein UV36_C0006G0010 [Parcubacteria group bacterium GW2011_GWC2_42_6]
MDLDELKKRLYEKDSQITDRPQAPAEFKSGQVSLDPATSAMAPAWEEEKPKSFFKLTKKIVFWLGGITILIVLAGLLGWYLWSASASFDKDKVYLEIFGPTKITSGEEATYIVKYRNNTNVALNDFILTFTYPDQALPSDGKEIKKENNHQQAAIKLERLERLAEGQQEFKAKVWGEKDSIQEFIAKISYRPVNFNSDFSNETKFLTLISSTPLILNFNLPQKITSGQTLNFSLQYINTAETSFSDLKLKLEYPEGFIFKSSLPEASADNNVWPIGELAGRDEGKIIVTGLINGQQGESKTFRAMLGIERDGQFVAYDQIASSPEIIASPLSVEQSSDAENNRVDLEQKINYKIKYRNTTNEIIGPVTIKVKIEGSAVDFSKITAINGHFSENERMIIWNTGSLKNLESLAAGQEGEITFSLTLKNKLPINSYSDKNFTVKTIAQIDSTNIPLSLIGTLLRGENELVLKVNSRIVFNAKAFYYDSLLSNSGPLPPRVGQQTTYTVHWNILNISNDLTDVRIESYLPPYMQWLGKISPAEENIKYEQATGKITWQIGNLSSGTGILLPVKTAAFQIGLTPAANQAGQIVDLTNESVLYAKDTFTDAESQIQIDAIGSNLPDDKQITWETGTVAP